MDGEYSPAIAPKPEDLRRAYRSVRSVSQALAAPLSAEDCMLQSMEDASPVKWHLAHTTWFWEEFVLAVYAAEYRRFRGDFAYLFNSYYEAVGARHERPKRGLLSRPSLDEVFAYRVHVDDEMERFISGVDAATLAAVAPFIQLGLAHEQQHQELISTDLKHGLWANATAPAAYPLWEAVSAEAADQDWIGHDGGLYEIGHAGEGFAFDNEGPRHQTHLTPFEIAARPVVNREMLEFISDGGYQTASLWLSDGWSLANQKEWRAPLYWRDPEDGDGAQSRFTLAGDLSVNPDAPVSHLSYYEAAAVAEWMGARLPSEAEWEIAARVEDPGQGDYLTPGEAADPKTAQACFFGGVWEWTRSAYDAYPGFRPSKDAVGEYNGKFMVGQYVLKGGSCATPRGHMRASYRNFFPPAARWQFSGLRLARDLA